MMGKENTYGQWETAFFVYGVQNKTRIEGHLDSHGGEEKQSPGLKGLPEGALSTVKGKTGKQNLGGAESSSQ